MKINKPTGSHMVNPYQKNHMKPNYTHHDKIAFKRDQLQISTEAKELLETKAQDPIRQERVNELKRQVENGEYQVNSRQVAEKMYQFWFGKE